MDAYDGWCGSSKTLHFRRVNEGLTRHMLQTVTPSLGFRASEIHQRSDRGRPSFAFKVQKPRGKHLRPHHWEGACVGDFLSDTKHVSCITFKVRLLLVLLLSRLSRVRLCATPKTAAHHAPPSPGFSRQEHWSGLPFPSPMHESEK